MEAPSFLLAEPAKSTKSSPGTWQSYRRHLPSGTLAAHNRDARPQVSLFLP